MEDQTTVGTDKNLYLYCFFKGPSFLLPQKGIDGANDTFVISYEDLCALVSLVPFDEYNEQTLNSRIQELEWLTLKVKRHEEIVRHVMGFHPVIPVKFCTIYTSSERVLEVMRRGYDEFCSFLDFISDKDEWGIKVYAEEDAGRKTIESSSELISQLDKKISSATPGEAFLLRKKRESLIQQQRNDFLNSLSDQVYQQMLSWSIEGRRNKLLSKDATGKKGDMILNAAFLINKLEVEVFFRKVDDLAGSYKQEAISFEISGPWPCYNFCPDFEVFKGEAKRGASFK